MVKTCKQTLVPPVLALVQWASVGGGAVVVQAGAADR